MTAATLAATALAGSLLAGSLLAGCSSISDHSAASESSATPGGSAGASWTVASAGTGLASPGQGPGSSLGPDSSQSAADAVRDGVQMAVAALPAHTRIRQVPPARGGQQTRATTAQGVWLISRPATTGGYGELLLLDPTGSRIRKAYPFPGLPPQWLLVTPAAVYCGRSGEGTLPDAMVCLVDRASGQLQVRVFADLLPGPATTAAEVAGRPGRWVVDDQRLTADFGQPPQLRPTELAFSNATGQPLLLDPDTLAVIGS
jgi:hypothetical protein